MGAINLVGTLLLFTLSRVNALHDWPNVVVSVCGPVSTLAFGLIAIAWFLDALRPGVFRRYLPGSSERWIAQMATSWAETRERRLKAERASDHELGASADGARRRRARHRNQTTRGVCSATEPTREGLDTGPFGARNHAAV